ncbi:MAG: hypothetical protein KDJ35_00730 [Alphaproteobacteria bacterium]|nr:hypothetical protein [Alphaproteobacteria bacterium]
MSREINDLTLPELSELCKVLSEKFNDVVSIETTPKGFVFKKNGAPIALEDSFDRSMLNTAVNNFLNPATQPAAIN